MTNRIALILALAVIAALIADRVLAGGEGTLFLARKLSDLIEYIAFWR